MKRKPPTGFRLGWGLLAFLGALALYSQFQTEKVSDTHALLAGAGLAVECLAHGVFRACPEVSHFPLLQYLVAIPLKALGWGDRWIFKALVTLNFLAFLGMVRIFQRDLGARSATVARVGLLVLLVSPFLYFARTTFGEPLAAFLTLALVAGCSARAGKGGERAGGPRLAALAFLAGLTKETAWPFLGLLALSCALSGGRRTFGRVLVPAGIGLLASVFAFAAFNVFRFGVPWNATLLDPLNRVPTVRIWAQHWVALWVSPQGGMVFFCLPFVVLFAFALGRGRRMRPGTALGILALFGLVTGFARWYSPFGWRAWGPRLLLPWMPALAFLWLSGEGEALAAALARAGIEKAGRLSRAALLGLWLIGLPHLLVLVDSSVLGRPYVPTPACPIEPVLQQDPGYFYRCIFEEIWPRKPIWMDVLAGLASPGVWVLALLYGAALFELAGAAPDPRK